MPRLRTLLLTLLPGLFASSALAAQAPPTTPLPEGVVATVNGEPISLQDYQDFLYRRMGKRPLQGMIDSMLVQQAAERFQVEADATEVERRFKERLEQVRRGKPEAEFADSLRQAGQDPATFLEQLRQDVKQEVLLDALVLATRVASDARLQQAFEQKYGLGGKKVKVKQILVMPHFLRAERIKAGEKPADIDQEAVRAEAKAMAQACLDKLRAGADWSEMVKTYSHDQVSNKQDGELPAYRRGLYGPEFTAAVESLAPGEYSEVVTSGAGFHIVQVAERKETRFEEVRSALVEEVMNATPNYQEREALLNTLRGQAKIQRW